MENSYELHTHDDPEFPIIFHADNVINSHNNFIPHWHENIELLCFCSGSAVVTCDGVPVHANAGDIVVVNSCTLHSIYSTTSCSTYYCLIVDKAFCDDFDLRVGETLMQELVSDAVCYEQFERIVLEFTERKPHYKTAIKAEILVLLTRLFRIADNTSSHTLVHGNPRLEMVKEAITYIHQNYKKTLSVDDICEKIGFSKYYFCRTFHELTGKTVVDFINYLRCENARRLLATGRCNVSESAERSGFRNLSYFSKIFKKHMGILPSEIERSEWVAKAQ